MEQYSGLALMQSPVLVRAVSSKSKKSDESSLEESRQSLRQEAILDAVEGTRLEDAVPGSLLKLLCQSFVASPLILD